MIPAWLILGVPFAAMVLIAWLIVRDVMHARDRQRLQAMADEAERRRLMELGSRRLEAPGAESLNFPMNRKTTP